MPISVGGLISGLDTNGMIDQLLNLQRRPIVKLQQREAAYQVKLSVYGSLRSTLSSLKSAMESLDSMSDLTGFSAVSGDTDLFTVSAGDTAVSGSYGITVTQMAEVHKLKSCGFSEGGLVGEGTIHLKVGSGGAVDIAVSATDTLDDVAEAINDAKTGVQAAVIFDGANYFLTLSGEDTGAANKISLTVTDADGENKDANNLSRLFYEDGDTGNQMDESRSAADSIITVDGVTDIHRDANIIDDVIKGVTITLQSAPAAPDNGATLTVSRDTSAIVSRIGSFVSAYNKALDFFDTCQSYNPDAETAGVLLGDGATNNIRNRLNRLVTGTVPGVESFSRLADLGIALNGKGHMEVNSSTLNSALDDHFDDVGRFFTQTAEGFEGFSVRMVDTLNTILDSRDGTLAARTNGIQNSIDNIHDHVERVEMRISSWETRTRARFQALEVLLGQYQTTGDYLNQQITGLQNLGRYISSRG